MARHVEPEEHAARLRLMATMHRVTAAQLDLQAAVVSAGAALSRFAQAMAEAEAADIAAHPDLAYLDLQMRGFYDDRPDAGGKEPW